MMHVSPRCGRAAAWVVVALLLACAAPSPAAVRNWTGATSGTWASNGNWSPTITPSATDVATFGLGSYSNLPALAVNASISGLDVQAGSAAVTIGGPGTLTIGSAGIGIAAGGDLSIAAPVALSTSQTFNNAAALTINGAATITSSATRLTLTGNGTTTLAGVLSGAGNVALNAAGDVRFTAAHSYTGTTYLTGNSNLTLTDSGAIGGPVNLSGGKLTLDYASSVGSRLNDAQALIVNGRGILEVVAPAGGSVIESVGALTLTGGHFSYVGGAAAVGQSSVVSFSSLSRSSGATATADFTGVGLGTSQNQIRLSGTTGPMGAWATYNSTDFAHSDAGLGVQAVASTALTAGTTAAMNSTATNFKTSASGNTLGANSSARTVVVGSTLDLAGFNLTMGTESGLLLSGGTISDSGATKGKIQGGTVASTLYVHAVGTAATSSTIAANIANNGAGGLSLIKAGEGTLVLSGSNSYTGATVVNAGTLQVDGTIGTGTTTVLSGAKLDIHTAGTRAVGGLVLGNSGGMSGAQVSLAAGSTLTINGNLAFTGLASLSAATLGPAATIDGAGTLAFGGGQRLLTIDRSTAAAGTPDLTIAVPIADAGGGWAKVYDSSRQAGTLALTADNTYAGATVLRDAGTTVFSGAGTATDSAGFWIYRNSTLKLDNSVANLDDRLGDFAPVTLQAGNLWITGNAGVDGGESIGDVRLLPGFNVLSIEPGAGQTSGLHATRIERFGSDPRSGFAPITASRVGGTLLVRGTGFGSGTGARLDVDTVALTAAANPGSPTTGILVGVVGDTSLSGNGSDLMTAPFGWGTVRPLTSAEYVSTLATAPAAGSNVKLTASETNANAVTLGGLVLGGAASVTLTNNAAVNLAGSMLLSTGAANNAINGSGSLTFGNAATGYEGVIYAARPIAIANAITDNAGQSVALTIAGVQPVTLTGNNSYSGGTTVMSSRDDALVVGSSNALGTGDVTVIGGQADSGVTMVLSSASGITINNNLFLQETISGRAQLRNSAGNNTYAGDITPVWQPQVSTAVLIFSDGGSLDITGDIAGTALNTGTVLFLRGNSTGNNRVSGDLVVVGGGLNKRDVGTWTVGAAGHTYLWTSTAIDNGTLKLGADNVLNGTVSLGSDQTTGAGNTVALVLGDGTTARSQTIGGLLHSTAANQAATLKVVGGGPTVATLTINPLYATNIYTFGGTLGGSGNEGNLALVKSGLGTQIFSLNQTGSSISYVGDTRLDAGTLSFAPTGSGAAVNVVTSTGAGARFLYGGGGTLTLARGSRTAMSLTVGDAAATSASIDRVGRGTLVIAPAGGTAASNLGVTEVLKVASSDAGARPTVTNGMVAPSIVGMNNDANKSGDFLTYDATNGFVTAAGSYVARSGNFSPAATEISNLTATATIAADTSVHALRIGAVTATLGGNVAVTSGGAILNGSTVAGGTLDFGTAEGLVFVNQQHATISSAINGSAGLTKFGPGTLTLSGTNGYTGGTAVQGGLLHFSNAGNLGAGDIEFAGGGLRWAQGTYTSSAFNGSARTVTLNTVDGLYVGATMSGAGIGNGSRITAINATTKVVTLDYAPTGVGTVLGGINNADISAGRAVTVGPGGATFDTQNNTVTFSGAIGNGGAGAVFKDGLGTLVFTQPGTYSGGTFVRQGYARATDLTALGSGAVTVSGGATLELSPAASGTFANALTLSGSGDTAHGDGSLTVKTGASVDLTGLLTISGTTATMKTRGGSGTRINVRGGVYGNNADATFYSDSGGRIVVDTKPITVGAGRLVGNFDLNVGGNYAGTVKPEWGGEISIGVDHPFVAPPLLDMSFTGGNTSAAVELNGHAVTISGFAANSYFDTLKNKSATVATLVYLGTAPDVNKFGGPLSGKIDIVAKGVGTLALGGANANTGTTRVEAGALRADLGMTATAGGATGAQTVGNVLSAANKVTLAGGTLEVVGRENPTVIGASGASWSSASRNITVGSTAGLSVGQQVSSATAGLPAGAYITAITGPTTFAINVATTQSGSAAALDYSLPTWRSEQTLGEIALEAPGNTIFVNNAGDGTKLTVAVISENGAGRNLFKTGAGTLAVTGASTYTGATQIREGTLALVGAGSIASSYRVDVLAGATLDASAASGGLHVAAGQTLAGTGRVNGHVSFENGAFHTPGTSPGIQEVNGNYTLATGSTLMVDLNGTAAGTEYDRVAVLGAGEGGTTVSLGGALDVMLRFAPTIGDQFTILEVADNARTIDGWFSNVAEGGTLTESFGGTDYELKVLRTAFGGGSVNDVMIEVVPEPSTLAMLAGLGLAGVVWQWRRRRAAEPHL